MGFWSKFAGTSVTSFGIGGPAGVFISGTASTKGQLLVATAANVYGPVTGSGDLTWSAVTAGAALVSGLQGVALPAPAGTGTVLTFNGSALTWAAGGGGGSVTWANDLSGSTSTNQYVVGISGSGGTAGTVSLGDGTNNLALTQLTSVQTTPPTLTVTSSAGFSVAATAGSNGGAFNLRGGIGGAGQGTNHTGGTGASISIVTGAGGAATGSAANAGSGALTVGTGAVGTGGSGTAGVPGQINFQVGGTGVLDFLSTTSLAPHTDNSLLMGTASLRTKDFAFVSMHGYPTSGATVAALIFQSVGVLSSGSNISGGSIWFYDATGSDTNSCGLTHTTNGSEVCFQDLFSNTALAIMCGGSPLITVGAATIHWNNGLNASAANASCVFDYPAQASANANGAGGGPVTYSTQPGQPCSGNAHTGGAGGAGTYKSAAGGTGTGTGAGVVGGAGGTTTIGGDVGGAATASTAGVGGKGGNIVSVGGTGGNGGATTGTSGGGGDYTFGSGAFGATGNTKGTNGITTFKVGGTNIWTYQASWAVVYSTPTIATTGTTTLSVAQYLQTGIDFGTITLAGNITVVFPNIVGTWFVDISRVTTGINSITLQSGSGTVVLGALTTNTGVLLVRCTGSNGISA